MNAGSFTRRRAARIAGWLANEAEKVGDAHLAVVMRDCETETKLLVAGIEAEQAERRIEHNEAAAAAAAANGDRLVAEVRLALAQRRDHA